jgi:hypothetical protein
MDSFPAGSVTRRFIFVIAVIFVGSSGSAGTGRLFSALVLLVVISGAFGGSSGSAGTARLFSALACPVFVDENIDPIVPAWCKRGGEEDVEKCP